jgi:hypothetical protein
MSHTRARTGLPVSALSVSAAVRTLSPAPLGRQGLFDPYRLLAHHVAHVVAQVEEGLGLLGRHGAFAGDMVGNPDLFDDGGRSRGEHENAVGEEYGFLDVVGDEDDALPFDAVDLQQLVLEKLAGLSVERTEGLIHQEDIGPSRQRAGDGDTLAHAAGDAVDIKIGEIGQAHQVEIVAGDLVLFPGVDVFSVLGPETDVFEHGEPGKRGVSLKDHALFAVGTDDFLAGPSRRCR